MIALMRAIYAFLIAQSSITNLVGTQIFRVQASQSVRSSGQNYIVYRRPHGEEETHLGGPSGFAREHVQFTCWARTFDDAWLIAATLRNLLHGLNHQTAFGSGGQTVNLKSCICRDYSDEDMPPAGGEEYGYFGATLEFVMQYVTTVTPA